MKRYGYLELRCESDGTNVTMSTTSSSLFARVLKELGEYIEKPTLTRTYYDVAGNLYQGTFHNLDGAEKDAKLFVWLVRWLGEHGWVSMAGN